MSDISEHGRCVAANVERLRKARRLSLRDLSERLGETGRPILPNLLHRLVHLRRRIDVDDLVALAEVLGVSPSDLLVPGGPANEDHHAVRALRSLESELGTALQDGKVADRASLLSIRLERLAFEVRTLLAENTKESM